jgi:hypothetical protein
MSRLEVVASGWKPSFHFWRLTEFRTISTSKKNPQHLFAILWGVVVAKLLGKSMIPSSCKSTDILEGLWPQDVCPTRMLCIPKELGKGKLHDFCSCEFSRLMMWDGENGCLLSPSSYVLFGVFISLVVLSSFLAIWLLHLLRIAYQNYLLRLNSLYIAMFSAVAVSVSMAVAVASRCVVMYTSNQATYDRFMNQILISRIILAPFAFVTLTCVGMSIYIVTLQTLQVPIDEKLDRQRRYVLLVVVALFCTVVVPMSVYRSYPISAFANNILTIICWWPFKRLGRRLRRVFPIVNLPPGYRERSFAISEKLRSTTNRIMNILYFRFAGGVLLIICAFASRRTQEPIFHTHLEALADAINMVGTQILIWIAVHTLTDILHVRLECAMNFKAISMLIHSSQMQSASISIAPQISASP